MNSIDTTATFWMPGKFSTMAPSIDGLFYFIYYCSVFLFVLLLAWAFARAARPAQTTNGAVLLVALLQTIVLGDVVIESGAPVGCSPHFAPRTKPRDASVS